MGDINGIYTITNKINGKVYVGQSRDIVRRWREHKNDLNDNKHCNYKLQTDWNIYGADNFEFNLIYIIDGSCGGEKVKDNIRIVLEDIYIERYDLINNGYNIEHTIKRLELENPKNIEVFSKVRNRFIDGLYLVDGIIIYGKHI